MATPAEKIAAKPAEAPKAKVQTGNRSPNYPQMNFAHALERVRKVYAVETTHSVPDETIAKDLGYTTLNGSSRTTLSALKKYGLLVPSGDGFKVGQETQKIIELPNTDQERATAMRKLALRPPVYKQLLEKYPGKNLPSDSALLLFLMGNSFEREAANQVIRFYKETLQYLEKEAPEQTPDQVKREVAADEKSTAGEEATGSRTPPPLGGKSEPPSVSEGIHLRFRISKECEVELAFLGPVTEEAISKFIQHLQLSKDDYPSLAETENKLAINAGTIHTPEVSDPTSLFDQDEDYDTTDEDYSDLEDAASE